MYSKIILNFVMFICTDTNIILQGKNSKRRGGSDDRLDDRLMRE